MDIVYIDELFFLNALTDYLLLLSAARLRALPLRRGRFALAAALGGLYASLCMLPSLGWLTAPPVTLALSLAMAWAAFGSGDGLWRSWAAFLALAAAFAGAVFAASLLGRQPRSPSLLLLVPARTLLVSFGLFYALLRLFLDRQLEKRRRPYVRAELTLREKGAAFTALRDTGNGLCDPISGRHVLIAEPAAVAPLFLPELPELPDCRDAAAFLRSLEPWPELRRRFRLIPYQAVGGGGLLLCFRPDNLLLDGESADLLVGLSPTPFSEKGDFRAIV